MGTNYYIKTKNNEVLHIGKRSVGWYFILHIYPEKNINELIDWIDVFHQGNIFDEYGRKINKEKMLDIIINNYKYTNHSQNKLRCIKEQLEGAFGLYSLETKDFS